MKVRMKVRMKGRVMVRVGVRVITCITLGLPGDSKVVLESRWEASRWEAEAGAEDGVAGVF